MQGGLFGRGLEECHALDTVVLHNLSIPNKSMEVLQGAHNRIIALRGANH